MKAHILLHLILITAFSAKAQLVTYLTPKPKFGCPNKTHNVTVGVKNTSGLSIPSGYSYSVSTTIYDNASTQIYTNTQSYSNAIANGDTIFVTLTNIPFAGPMICPIDFVFTYSYPIAGTYSTSSTYTVADPTTLTISESPTGTLTVPSLPDPAYLIRYYKDSDYSTSVDESATGIYTPPVLGSYTAKAYEPFAACSSATASNAIVLSILSGVTEAQNIQVAVYPNPITSSFTISTAFDRTLSYELSDMNGIVLKTSEFTSVTNVNVESLKTGTYLISIKDKNDRIASYKLVK